MLREADHAHEAATELEALVSLLPSEKSRQLAQLQVKASHKQAKDFRELAQRVKESWGPEPSLPIYVGTTEEIRISSSLAAALQEDIVGKPGSRCRRSRAT